MGVNLFESLSLSTVKCIKTYYKHCMLVCVCVCVCVSAIINPSRQFISGNWANEDQCLSEVSRYCCVMMMIRWMLHLPLWSSIVCLSFFLWACFYVCLEWLGWVVVMVEMVVGMLAYWLLLLLLDDVDGTSGECQSWPCVNLIAVYETAIRYRWTLRMLLLWCFYSTQYKSHQNITILSWSVEHWCTTHTHKS